MPSLFELMWDAGIEVLIEIIIFGKHGHKLSFGSNANLSCGLQILFRMQFIEICSLLGKDTRTPIDIE